MEVKPKEFSLISKACEGFSLIEVLIVVVIFAVIGVLMSQTIILTLQTTKKADTTTRVRQNVDFALASIDRQLHSAVSINSTCNGSALTRLDYTDVNGAPSFYLCNPGVSGYIASGSAQLTNATIAVTSCSFICNKASGPASVVVNLTASDANAKGTQNATVSAQTTIYLRTY